MDCIYHVSKSSNRVETYKAVEHARSKKHTFNPTSSPSLNHSNIVTIWLLMSMCSCNIISNLVSVSWNIFWPLGYLYYNILYTFVGFTRAFYRTMFNRNSRSCWSWWCLWQRELLARVNIDNIEFKQCHN